MAFKKELAEVGHVCSHALDMGLAMTKRSTGVVIRGQMESGNTH